MQELFAGRKIVVHDVEYFAVDPLLQSGKGDCIHTVIDVRKRYCVRPPKMQKETKRTDPYPAGDALVAGTIDIPRSDNDVRKPEPLSILGDDFVLFDFREAIGISPELGMLFNWTRLIQHAAPTFLRVGVNREGTDVDESPHATMTEACFEKIPRGDDGVQERIGK